MNYRSIYRKHHGTIPIDENGVSFDVHHIDGNKFNNNIENLIALSIQDHYEAHLARCEYGAAYMVSLRMKIPPEDMKEVLEESRKESGKKSARTLANKKAKGLMYSQLNPDAHRENSKIGGKAAALALEKRGGWTQEECFRRAETRRQNGTQNKEMEAANTPAAIERRVQTRKANGGYSTSRIPQTSEVFLKRAKTRYRRELLAKVIDINCSLIAKKDVVYIGERRTHTSALMGKKYFGECFFDLTREEQISILSHEQ